MSIEMQFLAARDCLERIILFLRLIGMIRIPLPSRPRKRRSSGGSLRRPAYPPAQTPVYAPGPNRIPASRRARPRRSSFPLFPVFDRLSPAAAFVLAAAAGLLAALLLSLAAGLSFYGYYQVTERILPGVTVEGLDLGGMTVQNAAIELHQAWNLERRLSASDGIHTLSLVPAELGLGVDALETARAAYQVGHQQPVPVEIDQMIAALHQGWKVDPVVTFDLAAARTGLEALTPRLSQPAVNASLRLEGETLTTVPGEMGYTINLDDTLAPVAADPRAALLGGTVRIALRPVLPAVSDVSAALAEAQRLLDTPVNLRAYDAVTDEWLEWVAPRAEVAAWLQIDPGSQGPQVSLDPEEIEAYLSRLSDSIGPERFLAAADQGVELAEAVRSGASFSLSLGHHPTTYLVQPGDTLLKIGWKVGMPYWMILQANPGLDPENLWAGQEIGVPSKDELLPLPAVPQKRIVIGIEEQRMWVYQDGREIEKFVISTGIDRSPTQPGIFQVQTHETNAYASVWDLHMPNFLGIYEAWPGFMNGIHGLPTLANGRRLWANILGRPASYGCIILDLEAAEWLFGWAEAGVVVEIRP